MELRFFASIWLINPNLSYPILSNVCKIGKNWIALHLNISDKDYVNRKGSSHTAI